jgi:hypothetical protein
VRTHVAVLVDETGHLLLQPVVLLHQQLVHGRQLPVHSLQARCLLPLLLAAPNNHKVHQATRVRKMSLAHEENQDSER